MTKVPKMLFQTRDIFVLGDSKNRLFWTTFFAVCKLNLQKKYSKKGQKRPGTRRSEVLRFPLQILRPPRAALEGQYRVIPTVFVPSASGLTGKMSWSLVHWGESQMRPRQKHNRPPYALLNPTYAVRNRLVNRLSQTISRHKGPIWALKFSDNGKFCASGGQDTRVYIWKVC